MSMTFSRLTAMLLAASTTVGVTTMAGAAEAHGKHKYRHGGLTISIGDGYYGYGNRYVSRYTGYGCGWLLERYEETGHPKWLRRWHRCRGDW